MAWADFGRSNELFGLDRALVTVADRPLYAPYKRLVNRYIQEAIYQMQAA